MSCCTKTGNLAFPCGPDKRPVYDRFRAAIYHAFTATSIRSLVPVISSAVDGLIDEFVEQGQCDFLEQFAVPLPLYVAADLLGVDRAESPRLRRWPDAFILRNGEMVIPQEESQAARDSVECQSFFRALMDERRRAHPQGDLITAVVSGKAAAPPLSEAETFSRGSHSCIGRLLPRRELAIAVPRLLARLQRESLDAGRADVAPVPHVRSVRAVHIRFTPGVRSSVREE